MHLSGGDTASATKLARSTFPHPPHPRPASSTVMFRKVRCFTPAGGPLICPTDVTATTEMSSNVRPSIVGGGFVALGGGRMSMWNASPGAPVGYLVKQKK